MSWLSRLLYGGDEPDRRTIVVKPPPWAVRQSFGEPSVRTASASNSIAIGYGAIATANDSIAIGHGAVARRRAT
jgi:hypothetical protein